MTERSRPWVTVVTATWNAEATLGATLESVHGQSLAAREHVVIDGGSTDGTARRVAAARAAGAVVRFYSARDEGIYDAFNRGLERARGEWVTFLGGDDVYADPEVLETFRLEARRHPEVDVLHADLDVVDAQRGGLVRSVRFCPAHPLDSPRYPESYAGMYLRQVAFPAAFIRRSAFERVGRFDPSYRVAGDTDWLIRAREAGLTFRYVPRIAVHMGGGGISHRRRWEGEREALQAYLRHGGAPLRDGIRFARATLAHQLDQRAPRLLRLGRLLVGSPRARPHGERIRMASADAEPGAEVERRPR